MTKYTELSLTTGTKTDISVDETKDFVGSGGEKKIFVKGQTALGVYHDPANAMPVERCNELAVLTHPGIVRPQGLLFKGAKRVGETMLAVQNPWVLCSLFTMTFRKRHSLDEKAIASIAKLMNEIVVHAHSHNISVVDNNENNWLLSGDFKKVYAIDTGNWQTPSFKATMISLAIKDPFNPAGIKADWYAQAILLANLWIGKHPFEADHPDYRDIPKASEVHGIPQRPMMQAMMKNRVAFFDPQCKLNKACFPLDSIPAALRAWMKSVLMGDLRDAPPIDLHVVASVQPINVISSSHKFEFTKLFTGVGDILAIARPGLRRTVLTTHKWYVDNQAYDYHLQCKPESVHIGTTNTDRPVIAGVVNGELRLQSQKEQVMCQVSANAIVSINGRLIVLNRADCFELDLVDLGGRIEVRIKRIGQLMDIPGATRAYSGCVIQNMLGSWRVLTFPSVGRCISTRLVDLEGGKILDAKYERGCLMVVGEKAGIYSRFTYFENDRDPNDNTLVLARTESNVSTDAMNWTVNARGTMTQIREDGVLEAMKATCGASVTQFTDVAITSDMSLYAEGEKTCLILRNEFYSLKVK